MDNLYIMRLDNVSRNIATYTCVFYLIFGNIGNIFKTLFFMQKPLRSCPCTVYILLATVGHFFTLNNVPISNLLSNNWEIIGFGQSLPLLHNETALQNSSILSEYSIRMCKIRVYFHMWSSNLSIQLLVFASINRFCMTITRKNREKRQRINDFFCSRLAAYIICSSSCITWALISLHFSFDFTITNNHCAAQNIFLWGTKLSSLYFFQSTLMIIFGTLTILYRQKYILFVHRRCRNHHEMIPIFNQLCHHCRKDRSERHHVEAQLTSMIVVEIILVILSSIPYAIYIVYRLIIVERNRDSIDITYENIIERLIRLTLFFEPSCGFYFYLYTLTSLKKRFFYIIQRKLRIVS